MAIRADRSEMKILLVNVLKEDGMMARGKFDPLGLAYLSSYAKRIMSGLDIEVISGSNPDKIFRVEPDLIGFSSVSQFFGLARKLASESSQRGIPTLLGGVHVTLLPESIPSEGIVGILGEGEQTFVELIETLKKKGRFCSDNLAKVKGIAFWNERGTQIRTQPRPQIVPLDVIPLPDRELLEVEQKGTVYLFSSRGCPFKCAFCASTRLFPKLRFFSSEYVVNEIQYLLERYRPVLIKFYDDLFIASKPRLRAMVAKIRDLGIHRKVLFSINSSASMIDEEVAGLLRQMNVYTVGIGMESGNQATLDFLKAGKATVDQNMRAAEILHKYGINATGSFIIGSPGERASEFEDTLNFITKAPLSNCWLYLLTPYPGTPLWDLALKRKLVSNEMDWDLLDIDQNEDFSKRIILSEEMTPEEIKERFRRFNSLRKKRYLLSALEQGLRRPDLILPYIRLHVRGVG